MRIAALACVLIALAVIGLAQWIDDPSTDAIYGATFWPTMLAVALLALNVPALLFSDGRKAGSSDPRESTPLQELASINWRAFLVPCLLVLVYPLAVQGLGFPLASILLYILLMVTLGQRGLASIVIVGTVVPLLLAYFFTGIAYMPLPKGLGPFEDLSIQIYRAIGAF